MSEEHEKNPWDSVEDAAEEATDKAMDMAEDAADQVQNDAAKVSIGSEDETADLSEAASEALRNLDREEKT